MRNFSALILAPVACLWARTIPQASAFVPTTKHPQASSRWCASTTTPRRSTAVSSSSTSTTNTPSAPVDSVVVLEDADAVGAEIRRIVEQAAAKAIAERGNFALAIPGGSILKMLVGSSGDDWTQHTTLAYVNHKCVPMDDADLATHAKATKLFLKDWKGVHAILMEGTNKGVEEAAAYEQKLR